MSSTDFDFLDGRWKIRCRRLATRLRGSTEWYEFDATKEVVPMLGGLGHIDRFLATGPDGKAVEALTLRIFDTATKMWSLYWVDNQSCKLDPPAIGRFKAGRGEFTGDGILEGKLIRFRICWMDITRASARMEQAFSADGGQTWEPNLQMSLTRDSDHARSKRKSAGLPVLVRRLAQSAPALRLRGQRRNGGRRWLAARGFVKWRY